MNAAGIAAGTYTITLSPSNVANATSGTQVTVTVSCTWGNVGLRPLGLISTSKQVVGLAVMRRE